jgi:hypothetical protein
MNNKTQANFKQTSSKPQANFKQTSSKPQADAQATFQACLNPGDEKERRPAFLFYYKDWLSDSGVSRLSRAEKGFYIDLLCYLFQEEGYLYTPVSIHAPVKGATGQRCITRTGLTLFQSTHP